MPKPPEPDKQPIRHDADEARGAEIILTKRRNKVIFIAGLIGFVLLALIIGLLS